ncbi:40S ribosomal protein S4-1-like [Juglans regia]|uniref:40S ribosomal protein S4-1-like n=1 Tax=Juglans regia TaxID=51240 RepID=A0A6P9EAS8_JUGRE|nr:40S ribosomal protein S4-1-like [Juglans regia]
MLDKLGGAFAPKPSSGPHKSRECLPLILILRNRLKYTLTYREVIAILMQRHVFVDAKVRTDKTYPAGFMDVVSIPKTNENFRLLYDTKGRFRLHSIRDEEATFKLCKVRSVQFGHKGIPYLNTFDGRTIRYPDPLIKANDTIKLDLETNKITEFIKFDVGNVVIVTGGRNRGRVGVIKNREKHKGTFETVHIQDALGHEFASRLGNVFTIGKGTKPWVSLPKGKGIKLSLLKRQEKGFKANQSLLHNQCCKSVIVLEDSLGETFCKLAHLCEDFKRLDSSSLEAIPLESSFEEWMSEAERSGTLIAPRDSSGIGEMMRLERRRVNLAVESGLRSILGDSNGDEKLNDHWFYHRAESLYVVKTNLLMEPSGHQSSLAAIKGAISTPFGLENSFGAESIEVG